MSNKHTYSYSIRVNNDGNIVIAYGNGIHIISKQGAIISSFKHIQEAYRMAFDHSTNDIILTDSFRKIILTDSFRKIIRYRIEGTVVDSAEVSSSPLDMSIDSKNIVCCCGEKRRVTIKLLT